MNKKTLIIMSGIIISFIVVYFFSSQIFLANSPKLRPDIGIRLAKLTSSVGERLASLFKRQSDLAKKLEKNLKDKPLVKIGSGVYAKSAPGESVTYIDLKNMEIEVIWVTTKKGTRIPVLMPKGQTPPSSLIEMVVDKY